MIPTKTRESRRTKTLKMPKNLERLYKEGKCRDCAVVVTRMDFAKILGKFTKVKIQYESSSTSKGKQKPEVTSPNSNVRLKSNENGMVLLHRNAYNQHPVKEISSKKLKRIDTPKSNILRENNRLKKSVLKDKNSNYNNQMGKTTLSLKKYGIIFEDPLVNSNNSNDNSTKTTLTDLLPQIDESILPSDEWCIDYFPKSEEPKDDKVYDRIAAELEDLMFNDKPKAVEQTEMIENKVDEFPSIMDILNDHSSDNKPADQNASLDFKPNLESSDVEAMLLGKSNPTSESTPAPMDVDNTDMRHLIGDVYQLNDIQGTINNEVNKTTTVTTTEETENPQSPSILDEALQKGIEEHLPLEQSNTNTNQDNLTHTTDSTNPNITTKTDSNVMQMKDNESNEHKINKKENNPLASITGITHVVFKKKRNGTCYKSVTCPKNLKYSIELSDKSVEFLGAPKFISNLEDLQVLLQIVNESELSSLYVLH